MDGFFVIYRWPREKKVLYLTPVAGCVGIDPVIDFRACGLLMHLLKFYGSWLESDWKDIGSCVFLLLTGVFERPFFFFNDWRAWCSVRALAGLWKRGQNWKMAKEERKGKEIKENLRINLNCWIGFTVGWHLRITLRCEISITKTNPSHSSTFLNDVPWFILAKNKKILRK